MQNVYMRLHLYLYIQTVSNYEEYTRSVCNTHTVYFGSSCHSNVMEKIRQIQ